LRFLQGRALVLPATPGFSRPYSSLPAKYGPDETLFSPASQVFPMQEVSVELGNLVATTNYSISP
jgi:hypothetical protein